MHWNIYTTDAKNFLLTTYSQLRKVRTIVWTDNYLDRQLSGQTIIWTDNCLDRQPSGQTMLPKRDTMHPGNTSVFDTCDTHAVCAATPTYIIRFSPSSASTCIIRITESTIF